LIATNVGEIQLKKCARNSIARVPYRESGPLYSAPFNVFVVTMTITKTIYFRYL